MSEEGSSPVCLSSSYFLPSNHGNASQPKQYTLISWPTSNRSTPSLCIIFPTPKGIAQCALFVNISTIALPTAINISDINKICTSISAAVRRPSSSCGGPTNLLPHPHVRILIKYETAVLEGSKMNQKKVRYHVFSSLCMQQYTTTSTIDCRLMYAPNQMAANFCSHINNDSIELQQQGKVRLFAALVAKS
jgi:hypothetical protein